jgi:hypothetical protein
MKVVALLFWWQHRRQLRAQGYSLDSFCEMTLTYWKNLVQGRNADVFCREQLRARW